MTSSNALRIGTFTGAMALLIFSASATQLLLAGAFPGAPISMRVALRSALNENYPWVLLTPLILWTWRRWPITAPTLWWRFPLHAATALATGLVFAMLISSQTDRVFFMRVPPPGTDLPNTPPPPLEIRTLSMIDRVRTVFMSRAIFHVLTYAVLIVCWEGLEAQRRSREKERQAADLARQLAEARLASLRLQLQPHFLFNTLNTICSLVRDQPEIAEEMIANLGHMFRSTLELEKMPFIPLSQEIALLDRYLAIEQTRFADRLTIQRHIDEAALDSLVPTLILRPLAENAFRHGIEPKPGKRLLGVAAQIKDARLCIDIWDDGGGFDATTEQAGIGLSNTRARLKEVYGADCSFCVIAAQDKGTRVEIEIPCRPPGSMATLST